MKNGTLRSQAGFSLVELMVVVAIIGVLAAMSAGQVQKQIAKARQSEAKTNLATLWSALEGFKSEYNVYTTDFVANKLGYNGKMYYHVGFSANHLAAPAAYPGAKDATMFNSGVDNGATSKVCPSCVYMAGATSPSGTSMTAAGDAYVASAGGEPMRSQLDLWTITNNKVLANPSDGIQ